MLLSIIHRIWSLIDNNIMHLFGKNVFFFGGITSGVSGTHITRFIRCHISHNNNTHNGEREREREREREIEG